MLRKKVTIVDRNEWGEKQLLIGNSPKKSGGKKKRYCVKVHLNEKRNQETLLHTSEGRVGTKKKLEKKN